MRYKMKDIKRLLEVRMLKKSKQPDFVRQQGGKVIRLPRNWRKPGGHQSKLRHKMKNRGYLVEPGWGSPAAVRGLDRSGLFPIIIHSINQLSKIDKKNQGAIISNVGNRKRIAIIQEAKKLGIKILNIKDVDKKVEEINAKIRERKERANIKIKAKEEKSKKKQKKEEKIEEKASVEEQKEKEKHEMEKVITKKA